MPATTLSVPDASSITRHVLTSGLTILVNENHTSPSVIVNGYLRCGSVQEAPTQSGLASFTATMLRRGTTHRNFNEINETLESAGAAMSVSGGRHLFDFGGKSLREDLDLLLEILTDVLREPTFPEEHVEKVRGQTLTGLQERDNDTRSMATLNFRQALYGATHPYGRSLSGERDTVSAFSRDDIVNFYRAFVSPRNGVLAVVGDVETKTVIQQLEQLFGDWVNPAEPALPAPPAVQPLTKTATKTTEIAGKTQTDLTIGWLGLARNDPDYYKANVANTILGRFGMMGRLGENVREKQGLAYYVYSSLEAGLSRGPWMAIAGVNPANVERTLASIHEEINRLRDEPVQESELADSKAFMTGILPLRLETNEGVADTLTDIELFGLGLDFLRRYPDLVNEVTAKDVQAVAARVFSPNTYALGIAGPATDLNSGE